MSVTARGPCHLSVTARGPCHLSVTARQGLDAAAPSFSQTLRASALSVRCGQDWQEFVCIASPLDAASFSRMPPHRRLPPHRGIRGRCVRRAGAAPRGGGSAAARRGGGRRRRGAGRDSDSCVRDGGARGGLQRHRGSVTCRCLLVVSVSFPCPHGPSIRPQQSHVPSASRPSKSFGITSLERHGTCVSRPFHVTSLRRHVPWASRLLISVPFG